MQLVVATRNPGKKREFESLLGGLLPEGTEVFDIPSFDPDIPDVVEDGETFEANAIKKAIEISVETECTTIADDSGLIVDALDGRPGVYSARYAGENASDEANNKLLIDELRGVPQSRRTARYRAVIVLCIAEDELGRALNLGDPVGDGTEEGVPFRRDFRELVWFRADCEGLIVDEPRGEGGFGYDPHFLIEDWGKTMAEVSLAQKNERSHRAAAIRKLAAYLSR